MSLNFSSSFTAKRFITLYSTTLRIGPLSKLVTEENLYDTFSPFGEIISIDVITPRSCAYIVMGRRQDAYEALTQLSGYKLQGTVIQVRVSYFRIFGCALSTNNLFVFFWGGGETFRSQSK